MVRKSEYGQGLRENRWPFARRFPRMLVHLFNDCRTLVPISLYSLHTWNTKTIATSFHRNVIQCNAITRVSFQMIEESHRMIRKCQCSKVASTRIYIYIYMYNYINLSSIVRGRGINENEIGVEETGGWLVENRVVPHTSQTWYKTTIFRPSSHLL